MVKKVAEISQVKLDDLIPYARNSRMHSPEQVVQIAASIKEFGFTNPVLIDANGELIAGHGRVMAARQLGMDTIPAIKLDYLTPAQKRAYVIADNKLALNATWDERLLAEELAFLQSDNFDTELTGFTLRELDDLLEEYITDDDQQDEEDIPQPLAKVVTSPGDVYSLGEHRLKCGDSTKPEDLEDLMRGGAADMLLTDPPYNVAYEGKTKEALTIKNDSKTAGEFFEFLVAVFTQAEKYMKPGAVFYIWYADVETLNFAAALEVSGLKLRQVLIWKKQSLVLGRKDYHFIHEPCLYGWKDGAAHKWFNDRSQVTVLEFDRPTKNLEHPTMKPVNLLEYQIRNNTERGDLVLDMFLGSGSTIIAAEKNGRICYGLELDPKYCDVIVKRWQDYTGKAAFNETQQKSFNALCQI